VTVAGPIIVTDLFPVALAELLTLLSGLSDEEWQQSTACAAWSVKDVALHLLGDDIGILSRPRDRFSSGRSARDRQELVALLNETNDLWVRASRQVSPRLLHDLLAFTGAQVSAHFASLDPHAIGDVVSWAGPEPAPVWLDLAREYTERWHHQQHIRDAVGKPGLKEARFFAPVLDTFVRALPFRYRDVRAEQGTVVAVTITGGSGGRWALRREGQAREGQAWTLYVAPPTRPTAEVVLDQEIAWRLFTKGIAHEQALRHAVLMGDESLAAKALDAVAILA
jgi:uncharacterized protein (TIGR03083 family)